MGDEAATRLNRFFVFFLSTLVVSCGGGSGGSENQPLALTVDLNISKTQTHQNDQVELRWSSSGSSSCTASGDWAGNKPASGAETIEAAEVGDFSFSLECSNATSTVSRTVDLSVLAELEIVYSDFDVEVEEDAVKEFYVSTATTNRDPLAPLEYSVSKPSAEGTVALSGGIAVYHPKADFFGEDTIEITVSGENQTAVSSITITVSGINDPPSLDVQFPVVYDPDLGAMIIQDGTLDFPFSVIDPDTAASELTLSAVSSGEQLPIEVFADFLRISLPGSFHAGPKKFDFSVSDGSLEGTSSRSLWLIRNLSDSDSGPRVNQFFGSKDDPLRGFNYLVVFDDIPPGEVRTAGYEALTYYVGGFLADFDDRRQSLIDAVFNVYVVDFPLGISSGLNIKTECYEESLDTYCAEEAQESAYQLVAELPDFAEVSVDAISIITGLDGRGVNLGRVNVQPLLGSLNGTFAGPNRMLKTLKHEFGHAFKFLGDHYTSDFLLEDDAGNKLIDMTDGLETLDAYNIDLTLEEDPNKVKWGHQFEDASAIAGLDRLDDKANDAVGYWSGCYFHDQKCFRSSYNSIMNGDFSAYFDEVTFDQDRTQFDHTQFDDVGAEAFALAVLQEQGVNSIDVELDENGDLLVGHRLRLPSTLFAIDWYVDGTRVTDWSAEFPIKLSGADLVDENGEALVERVKIPRKDAGQQTSIAYQVREISADPLILVEDQIDVFGDVYLGAFSSRIGPSVCANNNTSWTGVEATYCNSTISIRFADGWHYSPDWDNQTELLEERIDDLYYYYEDSGLGSQFFINWRFFE